MLWSKLRLNFTFHCIGICLSLVRILAVPHDRVQWSNRRRQVSAQWDMSLSMPLQIELQQWRFMWLKCCSLTQLTLHFRPSKFDPIYLAPVPSCMLQSDGGEVTRLQPENFVKPCLLEQRSLVWIWKIGMVWLKNDCNTWNPHTVQAVCPQRSRDDLSPSCQPRCSKRRWSNSSCCISCKI